MKKGKAVHALSWEATVGVGMASYHLSATGSATVDPALWVTTFEFAGPMHAVVDSRSELKVAGNYKCRFELSPVAAK
jgi:hypothetical protein